MVHWGTGWLVTVPMVLAACGGGGGSGASSDESSSGGADASSEGSSTKGSNVAPMVVNGGPPGTGSFNTAFISVTICAPGTDDCQTIDYVNVDTGSSGVRVMSSVLSSSLSLPQVMAATGDPLVECAQFDDGFTWGSVRLADVKVAGEVAANVPVQIIGDPAFGSVPSTCSSSGPSEDTVDAFGANGLIGINQIVPDCGEPCADPTNVLTGAYYSCSSSACTAVAAPIADQVANPIASFSSDNNGVVLQFPTVGASGAATVPGSLVFGIGTQANNGLGSATVQTVDGDGNFTTVFAGSTFATSFLDSGTSLLSFNDSAIAQCASSELPGFYCPPSPLSFSAQNRGLNGATVDVSFRVVSAQTLFTNVSNTAFDDVAGPGVDSTSFDWGFPFFVGRSVYLALDGATTPGGDGPYYAY